MPRGRVPLPLQERCESIGMRVRMLVCYYGSREGLSIEVFHWSSAQIQGRFRPATGCRYSLVVYAIRLIAHHLSLYIN